MVRRRSDRRFASLSALCLARFCLVQQRSRHAAGKAVWLLELDGAIGPATADYFISNLQSGAARRRRVVRAATRHARRPRSLDARHDQSDPRVEGAGRDVRCAERLARRERRHVSDVRKPHRRDGAGDEHRLVDAGQHRRRRVRRSRCPALHRDPEQRQVSQTRPIRRRRTSQRDPRRRPGTTMERKVVNDAVAYIRGLAELRGRNEDWAEKTVREAANLPASEALAAHVIDLIADRPRRSARQTRRSRDRTSTARTRHARSEGRRRSRASRPAGVTNCCR